MRSAGLQGTGQLFFRGGPQQPACFLPPCLLGPGCGSVMESSNKEAECTVCSLLTSGLLGPSLPGGTLWSPPREQPSLLHPCPCVGALTVMESLAWPCGETGSQHASSAWRGLRGGWGRRAGQSAPASRPWDGALHSEPGYGVHSRGEVLNHSLLRSDFSHP